jgi:hypothetical protein
VLVSNNYVSEETVCTVEGFFSLYTELIKQLLGSPCVVAKTETGWVS